MNKINHYSWVSQSIMRFSFLCYSKNNGVDFNTEPPPGTQTGKPGLTAHVSFEHTHLNISPFLFRGTADQNRCVHIHFMTEMAIGLGLN